MELEEFNSSHSESVVSIKVDEDDDSPDKNIQNGDTPRKPKKLKKIKKKRSLLRIGGQINHALELDETREEVDQSKTEDKSRDRQGGRNLMPRSSLPPRGRMASLGYLLEIFKEHDIESLYRTYTVAIYQSLVISLLFILSLFGIIMIVLLNSLNQTVRKPVEANVILSVTTLTSLVGLVLVCFRKIYRYINQVVAILVWVFMLALIYLFVYYFPTSTHGTLDHVPMVIFTIFVIHCMLPHNMWLGLVIGVVTGVLDIIVSVILAATSQDDIPYLSRQLGANVLLYICVNVVGVYNRYIIDIVHRMFFLETRNYIEAKVKYGGRKRRQTVLKEQLLTKVMPKYLVESVKETLNQQKNNMRYLQADRFHPLFVEGHSNVSILYADIVKFTPLAASLKPSELVYALNQLFGRFDQLALDHHCTRIKILGDCYYCVSGLPDPTPDHATNCVRMGQHMIRVIRQIRNETDIQSLDMRIGVHTGNVLCGLIGLVKWQFDIWSNSVTIANHMESAGIPGKVHVTSTTLEHLGSEFHVEPGNGGDRDEVIKQSRLETYLIDANLEELEAEPEMRRRTPLSPVGRMNKRMSVVECVEQWEQCHVFQDLQNALRGAQDQTDLINRRLKSFLCGEDDEGPPDDDTIRIDYSAKEMHPVLLIFRNKITEWDYLRQVDSWLPWSIMSSALCFCLIFGVQLIMVKATLAVYITFVLGFIAILVCGGIFLTKKWKAGKSGAGLWDGSLPISPVHWLARLLAILLVLMSTMAMSLVALGECKEWNNETQALVSEMDKNITIDVRIEKVGVCAHSSYFLYCVMLSMITCSLYLRLVLLVKLACVIIEIALFCFLFFGPYSHVVYTYDIFAGVEGLLHLEVRGPIYILMLFSALVALSWTVEKDLRLSYLWRMETAKERVQVHRQEQLNNILLENILPRHVADYFLDSSRKPDEVYHRQYRSVAVMFASISDFFYEETNLNKNGRECIRPLNELVIAFDRLSLQENYRYIEKIKMINTTFMAAAGLTPGAERLGEDNVVDLTRFAFDMMDILASYSQDFLANYKLRIGLSHGEVVAGVVGAQKPQYDIWGDTVNTASRMESHGFPGRIQVDKKTYKVLKRRKFQFERRGKVFVKGKGEMMLYYVISEMKDGQGQPDLDTQTDYVEKIIV